MSHANAALTPRARLRLARLVVDQGWPIARAAERYDVSWPTAKRWADRYRPLGPAGMNDASSRPHHSAEPDPEAGGPQDRAPALEAPAGSGPDRRPGRARPLDGARGAGPLPAQPALPRRPGHRGTDPPLRAPAPRVDLIHVDVKKLGNIPDGGGWRYVGTSAGPQEPDRTTAPHRAQEPLLATPRSAPRSCTPSSMTTPGSPTPRSTTTRPPPPPPQSCADAVAWFAVRGVTVERVLSDNGSCLPVPPVARHLRRARHHPQTNPALPAPDQRQDRTLPPHHGRRLGVQEVLQLRIRPPSSSASMDPRVQPPPAPHRDRQGRTPSHG